MSMISQASTPIKAATMLASSALLFLTGCNWDSHADSPALYFLCFATGYVTLQP